MYKKCKVVMLTTNEKSKLFIGNISGQLHTLALPDKDESTNNQHLYILSNDEIKEKDGVYDNTNGINPLVFINEDGSCNNDAGYLKIIATTNSFFGIKSTYNIGDILSGIESFPSIPQSFIEEYISEYNKGNKIEEIMVKYEKYDDYPPVSFMSDQLKLNSDNTINIKPTQDSYTIDEMFSNMQYYMEYCEANGYITPMEWLSDKKHF